MRNTLDKCIIYNYLGFSMTTKIRAYKSLYLQGQTLKLQGIKYP